MECIDKNIENTDLWKALNNGGWTNRRLEENIFNKNTLNIVDKRNVGVYKTEVSDFGTYKLEIELTAKKDVDDIRNMTLFAGRRNIVTREIKIRAGECYKKTFYMAVTPYIPALSSKRYNDKTIFISWTHADYISDVQVKVTREDVPVIWVAGDSTLTDQNAGIPYYPYGSCAGWAQTLLRFTDRAAVCNLAHSGMTSNCFRDDGHYNIAKELMKTGDLFIIQFGHNDQKRRNLLPFGGYKENLKEYIKEVRDLGGIPVICSPISRIPAKVTNEEISYISSTGISSSDKYISSGYYSLLSPYADACEEVARELNVPYVDLHGYTLKRWIEFGDDAKDYFIPGDITHTNEYGALLIADYFVNELKDKPGFDLFFENKSMANEDSYFIDDEEKCLPKELPGPDIFSVEPPFVDIRVNLQNSDISIDAKDKESDMIPEYDGIKKAFKYGLLDPCVMYAHPYAVMPRTQLLMVLFKALKLSGKRPYENKFKDITNYDWDAGYVQTLIGENLIDETTIGHVDTNRAVHTENEASEDLHFRPDDALTYAEFASFIIRFMEKDKEKRKSLSIEQCILKAEKLGIITGSIVKKQDEQIDFVKTNSNENENCRVLITNEKYPIAVGNKISRVEIYSSLAKFIDIAGSTNGNIPDDVDVHPVH